MTRPGRRLQWDEVEREFVIISTCLVRLSNAFGALAAALHRERVNDSVCSTDSGDAPGQSKIQNGPKALPIHEEELF